MSKLMDAANAIERTTKTVEKFTRATQHFHGVMNCTVWLMHAEAGFPHGRTMGGAYEWFRQQHDS